MVASISTAWNFTAPVKRFSIEGGMHYLELPNAAAVQMSMDGTVLAAAMLGQTAEHTA